MEMRAFPEQELGAAGVTESVFKRGGPCAQKTQEKTPEWRQERSQTIKGQLGCLCPRMSLG